MANLEHLKILKQGVEVWNRWREKNSERPDLEEADLHKEYLLAANLADANLQAANLQEADLRGANLRRANLRQARLLGTHLAGADLRDSHLEVADLRGANLAQANLKGAGLAVAHLRGANFQAADLSGVDLEGAHLHGGNFERAKLHGAKFKDTTIVAVDLSRTEGLAEIIHMGPSGVATSTLEITALRLSEGASDKRGLEIFYRGAGVERHLIHYYRSRGHPKYHSVFISYSVKDKAFALRLQDELQSRDIRCWLDEHHLELGDRINDIVRQTVTFYNKILLCCSEHSLNHTWVTEEIRIAQEREQADNRLILIPIDLDGSLLKSSEDKIINELRTRIGADFTNWEYDSAKFQEQLERLARVLEPLKGARELSQRSMPMIKSADALNARVSFADRKPTERDIEDVLLSVMRESGVKVIRPSQGPDKRFDFAVWIDQLDLELGNPILIEVKARVQSAGDASRAAEQARAYLQSTSVRSALIIYNEGPPSEQLNRGLTIDNIVFIRLSELLQQLRSEPFDRAVSRMINAPHH